MSTRIRNHGGVHETSCVGVPGKGKGPVPTPTFTQALRFWIYVGFVSFGGPAGQIALLHKELVDRRGWLSEKQFLHALNYCMLLPGPEAQQLATYAGWILHGVRGGIAAGFFFIFPSLLLLLALSALYALGGKHPVALALTSGIQPAVLALVLGAALRMGRRILKSLVPMGIAFGALISALFGIPFLWTMGCALLIGLLFLRKTPALAGDAAEKSPMDHIPWKPAAVAASIGLCLWAGTLILLPAGIMRDIGFFFSKSALVTFGGAYAVLPYVFQAAVDQYGWLSAREVLDGLALGESTPGPLIIVVVYIGFLGAFHHPPAGMTPLLSGFAGGTIAGFFTFLPSFLFILAGAPVVERTHGITVLNGPLRGITAAVVGMIAALGISLGRSVLFPGGTINLAALFIAAGAFLLLERFKWSAPIVVLISGAAGFVISLLS